MCNTTCNNPSHNECIDQLPENANIVYILNDGCECNKCSQCDEPKKVSCRSLACQQLNDECSCKKRRKTRKTTMVNVLENNVIRLEDKMNNGCSEMHQNIEEIINTVNNVYNELKDEEARAKLQEAFLHYGLDDAITRVEYNPEDRRMHFYHKNPANCLNVNVHEGCDCESCSACGCECSCNTDMCQSDIPYTMDEDCNIVPMGRDEVELFSIDCRDFVRDIFVNSARLEYEYHGAVDGKDGEGPWLVISFNRVFETDLANDNQNASPVEDLWIDLSKIWKLENYYDKPSTRAQIKLVSIDNTNTVVKPNTKTTIAKLIYHDDELNEDVNLGDINIKTSDVVNTNTKADFGDTTTIATIGDKNINITLPELTLNDATLQWNTYKKYGRIDGTDVGISLPVDPISRISDLDNLCNFGQTTNIAQIDNRYITVKMPNDPAEGLQDQIDQIEQIITDLGDSIEDVRNTINNIDTDVPVENLNVTVPFNQLTSFATVKGQDVKIKIADPLAGYTPHVTVADKNATLTPGSSDIVLATVDGKNITVDVPAATSYSATVVDKNATLTPGSNDVVLATIDGKNITVDIPASASYSATVVDKNATLTPGSNDVVLATVDGKNITVDVPATVPTSVTANNPTLQWGAQSTIGSVEGTPLKVTMPAMPSIPEAYQGDPFTGASKSGNTITLTRDSNTNPYSFDVVSNTNVTYKGNTVSIQQAVTDIDSRLTILEGLWKRTANNDGLEPVTANSKVYGAGFYDTTVS